jgi:chorismate dehydratase
LKPLRVGCVKYLNARPLVHGWPGEVLLDHPAALCAQLGSGKLDLALVSSFEFLRNPIYRIVDDISISSRGPVYSVILAYKGDIFEIDAVELDPAAETSGNLLRCLLAERGLNPRFAASWHRHPADKPGATHRQDAAATPAQLLIGDQAIRFRQQHRDEFQFWDLGEQWRELVNLPFVYALWLVRPEVANAKSIADHLRALRDENLAKLDELIDQEKEFDRHFCARYYREHLQFDFGANEKEGLRAFQTLCEKHGLLPKRAIEFTVV